jgi:hypothetical protein
MVGALTGVADRLGLIVLKGNGGSGPIRQVGRGVTAGDVNLAVLHIFRVNKLDVVDQIQFIQQHRTHQTIEIAAGNQAELTLAHDCSLYGKLKPACRLILQSVLS